MDAFQHRCVHLLTVPRVTRARARACVMSCLTMPPPPPLPARPCARVQGMAGVEYFVVAAGAGVHWATE